MLDQAPAAQHAYCPAQFEFVKQKPKSAACQLSPELTGSTIVKGPGIIRQSGSQSADSQLRPIRLPDAPLAIRQMPFAAPTNTPSGNPTAKTSDQLAATFQEQPALPLRPAPSTGPAWKRVMRPAPVSTKAADSPLISRLSKLTSANRSPGGHVAGVVPPHSSPQPSHQPSHQPSLHSSHRSPHHSPPLPGATATTYQAVQQQDRKYSSRTADLDVPSQSHHSPSSHRQVAADSACGYAHTHKPDTQAKQSMNQRWHGHLSATVAEPAKVAEPAMPDQAAAQSRHTWEEDGADGSLEGVKGGHGEGGGVEEADSPAPQTSPPSHPSEPQVKPKSTQRSRLRLQRPAAVTPSPAAPHSITHPFNPKCIIDTAAQQASHPSHVPDPDDLDPLLLESPTPGHPPGHTLGYSPKHPCGDASEGHLDHHPGHPLGYSTQQPRRDPSQDPLGHSPEHPFGHPHGLEHPAGPDAAADTPSASGAVPNRPAKGSMGKHSHAAVSALQVTSHNLHILTATIFLMCIGIYVSSSCIEIGNNNCIKYMYQRAIYVSLLHICVYLHSAGRLMADMWTV